MSAYLVSDPTIDVIVYAAQSYGIITPASADVFGQSIKRQNQYALHVRYGDPMPLVTEYRYTPFQFKVRRRAIDGCIRCWEYQCSEFDGVEGTAISQLVQAVYTLNRCRLVMDTTFNPEASVHPYWGVTDHATAEVAR